MTTQKLTTPRIWRDQIARAHTARLSGDDEEFEAASERLSRVFRGFAARLATTPDALAVKAMALRILFAQELKGSSTDARLLRSFLDDVEALGRD